MIEAVLATLGWLVFGAPSSAVLIRAGRPGLAIGVMPFAGMLALLVPVIVAAWTGGSLAGQAVGAGLTSLVLAAFIAWQCDRSGKEAAAPIDMFALMTGLALLVGVGVLNLVLGFAYAEGVPNYDHDAYQMWLLRAKILAQADVFPAALYIEPQLTRAQWQYPLAYPATVGWMMKLGGFDVRSLHIPVAILAALLPLANFALLARVVSPWIAVAASVAPFVVPGFLLKQHEAAADPLLVMVAMSGCATALLGAVRGDRSMQCVAGLILACAVSIKNDGALWVVACGLSSAALAWSRRSDLAGWLAGFGRIVGPSVVFFVVWNLTTGQLGVTSGIPLDASHFGERLPVVAGAVKRVLLNGSGAFVFPACVVALGFLVRGSPLVRAAEFVALLALPGIYLLGIVTIQCAIYISPPFDIMWLLVTSLQRLTFGVTPALFVAVLTAVAMRERPDASHEQPAPDTPSARYRASHL